MYNNSSNVRLPKHFPIQTLTPLQLKTLSKFRRGSSINNISNRASSISNRLSTVSNRGSSTNSRKSKSRTKVTRKNSGQWNKTKNLPRRNMKIVGDALVAKLDNDNDKGTTLDLNGNDTEPFSEQISKDIALAVAMIVAEHQMVKAKQKEEELKKKKALKLAAKEKEVSGTSTPQKIEVGKRKSKVVLNSSDAYLATQQYHRSKTSMEKGLAPTNSNLANNNVPSSAAPPNPEDKQKGDSESDTDGKCEAKQKPSVTFSVPSRTMVAAIPSRPPTPTETELPSKKRSVTLSASSSRKSTTTALPPSTASAASSLSSTGSRATVSRYPPLPTIGAKMGGQLEVLKYLARVQNYMNHLGYHRYGEPKIHINSRLSMKMQMVTAREMMQSGLPIKCLHAVVLAVHFTNCLDTVERFPIYFRSHVTNKEYKHIVLGIYVQGHFGALGISRDCGLQDKPATYSKLSDLIFEYAKCYGQSGHILNEIKLGNIITHDQHSLEKLFTKNYVVPVCGCLHSDIEKNVEKFAKQLRSKMGLACIKSLRIDSANSSKFSRSRSSLNGHGSGCGSGAGSCSTMRTRTMSMLPLRGSKNEANNNNSKRSSKQASKVTFTRSKPTLLAKKK